MIPKQIFTYWEGEKPPYIEYCIDTIIKNSGVKVHVITPENLNKYLPKNILNEQHKKLSVITQKTDCIRLGILYEHGGMWCDADTIFLKDCSKWFNTDVEFVAMQWTKNKNVLNGYFFAKKNSLFILKCLEYINNILKNKPKNYYYDASGCFFGESVFTKISEKQQITTIPLSVFIPVEFPNDKDVWYKDIVINKFIKPETVAIAFNHSQHGIGFKNKTMEEHLKEKNLFSSAIKYCNRISNNLKIVSITEDLNSDEFCINSIESVYEYMYKMIFVYKESKEEAISIISKWKKENDKENKIIIGDRASIEKIDYDYKLKLNTDMVWDTYELEKAIDFLINKKKEVVTCQAFLYIKSPFYKKLPVKPYHNAVFIQKGLKSGGKKLYLMENVHFHCFAGVRKSMYRVLKYWKNAGLEIDWQKYWIENTWNKMPDIQTIKIINKSNLPIVCQNNKFVNAFLDYAPVKQREKVVSLTKNLLLKYHLPEDFSPMHKFFKAPSYRNRYYKAIKEYKENE